MKADKDLKEAVCLLEILSLDRPADLYPALLDVCKGKSRKTENQMLEGFKKACMKGLLTKEAIDHFEENCARARVKD
ncbi:MAG: hypothetical protein ACI915_005117 [Gammaproteobacteria bacterium]